MPWDRKRLLGYVETIQLLLGVTDKREYSACAYMLFCFVLVILCECAGSVAFII